ncbi:multiple monosaccharide ABC transporter substrate-binding protein [Buchananella hordeovulneris]|uniref:ABC transporter substrate-binding protein n=1 Tax=Buchananella hordeovulneris TaxID=52770 RepID=A0A1Q5PWJ9_9ACTO|nr:multiple monosaccharide ABC transporter substrate-binding protein [Buchananella hordeovulneris]OKL51994.1 ABC transporter substrate-binding protein [Buchananella hordeovulneris]RRD45074.1 sugar ABC transporter substrate-binding protein [Buchananella hordeovulneris]RRD52610.1 sugar ABC transporter substrate-binding protein [Buchananella hordeovulneris]
MQRAIARPLAFMASLCLLAGLTACSAERSSAKTQPAADGSAASAPADAAPGSKLVGISMPTKSLERWSRDGEHLVKELEALGYDTTLQFADNKVEQQISQIQNMINEGPAVLVVGSIDGSALAPVLDQAAAAGIKVIAYDRLIRDSEAVDYYATFDNYQVGKLQGEYIVKTLDLANNKGPFNLEPFSGSPDDNNAKFFFAGAWDQLSPYVESGVLVVPSGKAPKSVDDWQSIGIQAWMAPAAQAEMETRLNSFYQDKKVQAVLAPNDALALGITQALESAGYSATDLPVITGQDADLANVQNIINGKQTMTVWKDTRKLGTQVAKMVDQIVKGEEVTVNDTKSYENGKKVVPSFLIEPQVVTKDNVKELLVDSGYYQAEELGL